MSKKNENHFWSSYSDLMTSMFFIMLMLFILAIVGLKREQKGLVVKAAAYDKIMEMQKTFAEIDTTYFQYREDYKKHVLKLAVQYHTGQYDINTLTDNRVKGELLQAGKRIVEIIGKFKAEENINYLVIIEGQASADGYNSGDFSNNNVLSYQRALKLKEYWKNNGIDLDKMANCELIVAGSGEGGMPREKVQMKNQRFLIHIIPKTGDIRLEEKK